MSSSSSRTESLLYAKARRSFRSGGFNFFAPPLPGFGNEGGAEYDAETATDIELGLKWLGQIGDAPTRMNLAAYKMKIEDIQRSNYVPIFGALAGITVNVPEAEVQGIEFDGTHKSGGLAEPWLVSQLHRRRVHRERSLGPRQSVGRVRSIPGLAGILGHAVRRGERAGRRDAAGVVPWRCVPPDRILDQLHGNTLNPGTEIPGYTIANFRAGIDSDSGWSFSANVKNAFDKVYYVGGIGFASLFAINTVIPGAPRTYFVEARYRF